MVFGIVGCATNSDLPENTSETSLERARYCKVANLDKYWGDCWINRSKAEPTFFAWIEDLEMQKDWDVISILNSELLKRVQSGEYSPSEANKYFDIILVQIDESLTLKTNTKLAEQAEKTAAFRRAMGNLSRQMKENSDAVGNNRKPISTGQERRLQRQTLLSDNRRSCVYGVGSNQKIFVTAVGGRCPSSM